METFIRSIMGLFVMMFWAAFPLIYLYGIYLSFFKGFFWFLASVMIPPVAFIVGLIGVFD